MSDAPDTDTAVPEDGSGNLGDMLRRAREQRDLTIENLALGLRLEPRIIRQLENNQFDQLPAPAFTRGYIRSIAKELHIEAEPLLQVLDSRFQAEPPALADFESRAPTQITSDSTIIRYATVALLIVTLILVALWWRAQDNFSLSSSDNEVSDSAPALPPTPPLDYQFETIVHPDQAYFQAPGEVEDDVQESDAVDEVPSNGPIEETVAPSTSQELLITTREDAWVEVRDTLGTRLYYNLVRPERELRLSGAAPYALTIGNAPAVTVNFSGEAVDLQPFISDGIARLELGEGDTAPQAEKSIEQ